MPLKKNLTKRSIEWIESKEPGKFASQLVYNQVVDNKYRLWFISNKECNVLFYLGLSESVNGTLAWTNMKLAINFINRIEHKKTLLRVFGPKVLLVKMSLFNLQSMLNPSNVNFISTILVNPSDDYFTPFPLSYFREKAEEESDEVIELLENDDGSDVIEMVYNSKERKYQPDENKDFMDLVADE